MKDAIKIPSFTELDELQRREFVARLQHQILYDDNKYCAILILLKEWEKQRPFNNSNQ